MKPMNKTFLDKIKDAVDALYPTQTSELEIEQGVVDDYGVVYSPDFKRLLKATDNSIAGYVVKDTVEVICDYAFSSTIKSHACRDLKNLILPKSLKVIGNHAFQNNLNLISISIQEGLEKIGAYAFAECFALKGLTLPKSLLVLDDGAFSDCILLKQLRIRANDCFLYQGSNVFERCIELPKKQIFDRTDVPFSPALDRALKQHYGIDSMKEMVDNVIAAYEYGVYFERSYKKMASFETLKLSVGVHKYKEAYLKSVCKCRKKSNNQNTAFQTPTPPMAANIDRGWVDLGLNVKWAQHNIGTFEITTMGRTFRWGQKDSMTSLEKNDLETCCADLPNIAGNCLYDAAANKWGGLWRMPYKKDFEDLIDDADWYWIEKGRSSGYYVMGNSGKYVFLPSTTIGATKTRRLDPIGMYWTATQCDDDITKAFALIFDRNQVKICPMDKKIPMVIRPVFDTLNHEHDKDRY